MRIATLARKIQYPTRNEVCCVLNIHCCDHPRKLFNSKFLPIYGIYNITGVSMVVLIVEIDKENYGFLKNCSQVNTIKQSKDAPELKL